MNDKPEDRVTDTEERLAITAQWLVAILHKFGNRVKVSGEDADVASDFQEYEVSAEPDGYGGYVIRMRPRPKDDLDFSDINEKTLDEIFGEEE